MQTRITTTITTTTIDLDTLSPEHRVEVVADDPLPEEVVRAAARGGCKAALGALEADPRETS